MLGVFFFVLICLCVRVCRTVEINYAQKAPPFIFWFLKVTIILPLVKTCEGGQVSISTMIESIESLKAVWPYSVEIMVFPFEHPGLLYDDLNCDDFDAEYAKNERSIYMMEISELNGDNAHPIFKAIKEIMKVEESGTNVNVDKLNYFIIDPDWEILHHHYNKSLMDIKDVLREMIKVLDPVDEL